MHLHHTNSSTKGSVLVVSVLGHDQQLLQQYQQHLLLQVQMPQVWQRQGQGMQGSLLTMLATQGFNPMCKPQSLWPEDWVALSMWGWPVTPCCLGLKVPVLQMRLVLLLLGTGQQQQQQQFSESRPSSSPRFRLHLPSTMQQQPLKLRL